MATIDSTVPVGTTSPMKPSMTRVALWASAAVAVSTALVDLMGHPAGGEHELVTSADYAFTALLIPFALVPLAAVAAMHALHGRRGGRPGRVGLWLTAVGMIGFVAAAVATLISADPHSSGPIYPLAMLATIVGLGTFAVGADRARMLPRWAIPVFAAGWILGGPVAPFHGGYVLFAAACIAVAVGLGRRGTPAEF